MTRRFSVSVCVSVSVCRHTHTSKLPIMNDEGGAGRMEYQCPSVLPLHLRPYALPPNPCVQPGAELQSNSR